MATRQYFDDEGFEDVKQGQGIHSQGQRHPRRTLLLMQQKRAITEKMDEDPAFYQKFSKLIQQAIDDFRARRISDLDYLSKVSDIRDKVVSRQHDDMPKVFKAMTKHVLILV